jgi:MFS family permease
MSLVDRATAITLRPQTEWPVIAAEPNSFAGIFTGYVAPLAAIGPIALIIGLSIVGIGVPFLGTYRTPLGTSIVQGIVTFVMVLIGVAIMTAIAGWLAPHFGGRRDNVAALKLVGYAYTPAFIAGILGLFPPLSFLEIFAGLWTLYVFYRGAAPLLMSSADKALAYTATCVVCGIVLGFIGMSVAGAVGIATGAMMGHGYGVHASSDAQGRAVVAGVLGSAMGGGSENTQSASWTPSQRRAPTPIARKRPATPAHKRKRASTRSARWFAAERTRLRRSRTISSRRCCPIRPADCRAPRARAVRDRSPALPVPRPTPPTAAAVRARWN